MPSAILCWMARPPLIGINVKMFHWHRTVAGPVVTVDKPSAVFARIIQATVGIRAFFADFHSCGSFHRPFFFFGSFSFLTNSLRGRPAGSRYEPSTPLPQRLEETFERDQRREPNVYSDAVLRGLDYKDYAHSLPVVAQSSAKGSKESIVETTRRTRRIYRIGLGR